MPIPSWSRSLCRIRCPPLGLTLQDKQMGPSHAKSRCRALRRVSLWLAWMPAQWFSKLDVIEPPLSGAGCKSSGCPVWGPNPLLLREKLRVLSSLPAVGHCYRWDCVPASPTCFHVDFPSLPSA